MSTVSTRWQAIRWSTTWLRQLRFHHLSFVGGLALAAGSAVSMGAFGGSTSQSVPVRSDQASATSTAGYTRWAVDHVVLYLIRSNTVIDVEISQAEESLVGASHARTYRIVETPADERQLEEELNDMFYNNVSFGVVDLRGPVTQSP